MGRKLVDPYSCCKNCGAELHTSKVLSNLALIDIVMWYRSKAQYMGRKLVAAMKDKLGKQLFEVIIQASANGTVVARETIKVCTDKTPDSQEPPG